MTLPHPPRSSGAVMLLFAILLAPAAPAIPGTPAAPAAAPRVVDFSLRDARGRVHSTREWRGRKAVVLFVLGLECPVSNGYAPEMGRIAASYGPAGVAFYGLHPDPDVTAEAASRHAADYDLTFPILLDPAQAVARRAGVRVTPEAVVLASDGTVLYRGRIDDRYSPRGHRLAEPRARDLRAALDAVVAGRPPEVAATEAVGCLLPRSEPAPR